jgi:hypothetical protein
VKVKQWCTVTHGASGFGSFGVLLVREVEMGAIPGGDETACIELYREEGHGAGPMVDVKRRYWNFAGTANLELPGIHVDPQGPLLEHFNTRSAGAPSSRYSRPWFTGFDGDPLPLMLACGWTEYLP